MILPYTQPDHSELPKEFSPEGDKEWLSKAHADDAAYDLRAVDFYSLAPGDRNQVRTGLRIAIPEGHAGLVLPRSGLALKHGIFVLNSPGLIDPGYRGEVGVILANFSDLTFNIDPGERIAQLLLVKTSDLTPQYWSPDYFDAASRHGSLSTERGEGGFGSTGNA